MFKIGDFSRLSLVTVKTLRYYDEIGLLKPVMVDRFTGYRYYTADQLLKLNYIVALKNLGLSLNEVTRLANNDLTPAQMRDIFILRKADLEQRISDEQRRLEQVEKLLRQIEKEGTMTDYQVVVKKVEPQIIASIRDVLPTYGHLGQLYGELVPYVFGQGGKPGDDLAVVFDIRQAGCRPYGEGAGFHSNGIQIGDSQDVDQMARPGQVDFDVVDQVRAPG